MYGQEAPIPPLVIKDPTSSAGKKLIELHAAAEEATRILHANQRAHRDAIDAVGVAQAALAAELDRGSRAGKQDSEVEIALVRKIEDSKIAADHMLHAQRIEAAVGRQNQAAEAVRQHIEFNILDLLDELRPEAERVTAELSEAREAMAPFQAAYNEMAERVNSLTAAVHRFRQPPQQYQFSTRQPVALNTHARWVLAADETSVPMPDAAVVEEWDKRFHPERYDTPAAVESTEEAA